MPKSCEGGMGHPLPLTCHLVLAPSCTLRGWEPKTPECRGAALPSILRPHSLADPKPLLLACTQALQHTTM